MYRETIVWAAHVTKAALFCCVARTCLSCRVLSWKSVSANSNEESTDENCHLYILVLNAVTPYPYTNKTPIYSTWGLLSVCAACPTPRLNQSYELLPPREQHLRYVPHRVRNGCNTCGLVFTCHRVSYHGSFRKQNFQCRRGNAVYSFSTVRVV